MTTVRDSETLAYLDFAHQLADLARPLTLSHFRSAIAVDNKNQDHFDPVTAADRDAEQALRTAIQTRFPDHSILGEEYDDQQSPDPLAPQWIIDPIDGTRAYISGKPNWGTLIGLYQNGVPLLGLVDMPATNERLWALAGGSAEARYHDTQTTACTRSCATADRAHLATTSPDFFNDAAIAPIWAEITKRVRLTLYGGDCTNYALLAGGHIDLVIERDLKPYDILPLRPIIEAAGGIITDWQGEVVTSGGHVIACGDRKLHAELLPLLQSAS